MNSTLETKSRTLYTEAEQDANWDNLSQEQRDYFNRLAEGDPERTGQAFFEDTVSPELQDDPSKLDVFLNGGTVTVHEWEPARGRAGGEWVEVEHEIPDRDWSHDTSRANGGSDSADNGRWEDASTNRSRGSRNTTEAEQQTADDATQRDVDILEEGTIGDAVTEVADASAWAAGAEVAGELLETTLDGLLPITGGVVAAKVVADQFETTADKLGYGSIAGGATVAVLCTPPGQAAIAGYVVWNLAKRGVKLWKKHVN